MKMVKVDLKNSYGYRVDGTRRYYGPGKGIMVPIGLAQTLGLSYEEIEAPAAEGAPVGDDPAGPETPLPAGFPGLKHLMAAGYTTYSSLSGHSRDDLVAIKGIGEATADAILFALPKEGEATGEERTGVEGALGEENILEDHGSDAP